MTTKLYLVLSTKANVINITLTPPIINSLDISPPPEINIVQREHCIVTDLLVKGWRLQSLGCHRFSASQWPSFSFSAQPGTGRGRREGREVRYLHKSTYIWELLYYIVHRDYWNTIITVVLRTAQNMVDGALALKEDPSTYQPAACAGSLRLVVWQQNRLRGRETLCFSLAG